MRAALLISPEDVVVREVDTPGPGPSEVLVGVKACGVCATDVKKFTGSSKAPHLPFILGHEPAGVVLEVGSEVGAALAPGARVAVAPVFTCGVCLNCRTGRTSSQGMGMCQDYKVLGYSIDGAFAEQLVAPLSQVHPIPDGLSFSDAALIEPVAACANGVMRASCHPPGTVMVIGAGFMGLVTIQLLRLLGHRVIASDLAEERRALALQSGAEGVFDPQTQDVVKEVNQATAGRGADAVVFSVGGKALTQEGLAMLAPGGTAVLLASAAAGTTFEVDLNRLHYDQSVITGSVSYTGPGYQWSMDLLSRGMLDTKMLITAEGPLEDVGRFLAMTRDLQGLKKVVRL